MDIEGKERNQWIDDAWFVIAKSHFYKQNYYEADRGFTYISRRFKDGDRKLESLVWQARTAIQLEQFAKAKDEKQIPAAIAELKQIVERLVAPEEEAA